MKPNKFREMDTADLTGQARETEEQLFRLRFQIGMGQTDGREALPRTSKDRARMLAVCGSGNSIRQKRGSGGSASRQEVRREKEKG